MGEKFTDYLTAIRGGQGRTGSQVADSATAIVVVGCLAFVIGGVLALAEWLG